MSSQNIHLIYQDAHLLAVDKPSGLLCVPGRGADKQDCLVNRLLPEFPGLRVVHRLDRDTSGVMIFALDAETQRALSRQFEERRVEKIYHARVHGCPEQDEGLIDLPLRRDMEHSLPPRYRVDREQGREARTRWEVLERDKPQSLLALYPETGRSHQLRVHLSEIAHPIVGDPIYGLTDDPAPRLMLHAVQLQVTHPQRGEVLKLLAINPATTDFDVEGET